jgi:hypothetical protein
MGPELRQRREANSKDAFNPEGHFREREARMKVLMVHNAYQEPGGEDTVVAAEGNLLTTARPFPSPAEIEAAS